MGGFTPLKKWIITIFYAFGMKVPDHHIVQIIGKFCSGKTAGWGQHTILLSQTDMF
jgi:hypothetical protein